MDSAEKLMETRPDSAYHILSGLNQADIKEKKNVARYSLLMAMALDKNYIDTTNIAILSPALDYYPKYGNSDQRLKTLYYAGRIHMNAHDYDGAKW